MTCTQAQAEQWLLEDIGECVRWLNTNVLPYATLTQGEFDALVDFSFNLGLHALAGSTLLKDVLASKMALAAAEFEHWDKAGGKAVAGLLRRRLAELHEFVS
jgi:lysozyme